MEDNVSTMASEPAVAYRTTSYMDAMAMIHTMHLTREDKERVGRRLVVETTEANLSKAFDTLEHLSTLQLGWDGCNALPISKKVINNLRSVLLISDNDDWKNWMISPDGNATIMLQSATRRASISVGAEEFSYYLKTDGIRKGESHVDFSASKLLFIMRELNK
jgi:hypothetical protein